VWLPKPLDKTNGAVEFWNSAKLNVRGLGDGVKEIRAKLEARGHPGCGRTSEFQKAIRLFQSLPPIVNCRSNSKLQEGHGIIVCKNIHR
jgi:hypothetical protein